MTPEHERIRHVLNKLVPDIRQGCTLQTAHGSLVFSGADADALAKFTQDLYNHKASQAVQLDGCVHCGD